MSFQKLLGLGIARRLSSFLRAGGSPAPQELDMTPEASDLLTQMPWWAARGLVYVILSFVAVTLLWSYFSMISVVVEARGRLIPEGNVQPVQALANGTVQAVRVREGEMVSRGQALMHLTRESFGRQARGEAIGVGSAPVLATISAPVAGIITRLDVNSPGTLVQMGQQVAAIAPVGARLVVEAQVLNKDIALVERGLEAKLRFDAFPIQDYDSVSGSVVEVSPDAHNDEKLGSFYKVVIAIRQTSIPGKSKPIALRPGLSLTAEIITERKSILSLLLEPFRKLKAGT
ncbi:MAG TPA: HlyD family efflux transporter periplasmic adaptor subunit [Blastocatellia bacterium]|nr:HlyD family efflux transporter periplasmic adaptor subunit [Blastocatellia bacterium]